MMSTDKNKNPFRVPENYFEEVNGKIIATAADTPKVKQFSFFKKFRPVLAAAASLVVLLTIGYLAVNLTDKKPEETGISELFTIDPEILINEIDMATLENAAGIQSTLDKGSGLSNDEIIDYLVSDDIDISVIYEKL